MPRPPTQDPSVNEAMLGTSGPPVLVDPSMIDAVDRDLDTREPAAVLGGLTSGIGPVGDGSDTKGPLGCAGAGGAIPVGLVLGLLCLVALAYRRRRQQN